MTLHLSGLLDAVRALPGYDRLRTSPTGVRLSVPDNAKAPLVAALARDLGRPILWLTAQSAWAKTLAEQLPVWLGPTPSVSVLAEHEGLFYEQTASDARIVRDRIAALDLLIDPPAEGAIVIASARAALPLLTAPDRFRSLRRTYRVGDRVAPEQMLRDLVALGYRIEPLVVDPGTASRRGGIVDVFPLGEEAPIRVEFFGDEVDSLRRFDPATQRSTERVDTFRLLPAAELLPPTGEDGDALAERLRALPVDDLDSTVRDRFQRDVDRLIQGEPFEGIERYAGYLGQATVLDYLTDETLVVVDEPAQVAATVEELERQAEQLYAELLERAELPRDFPAPFCASAPFLARLGGRGQIVFDWRSETDAGLAELAASLREPPRYGGRLKQALNECRIALERGASLVVVTLQAPRLQELFAEYDQPAAIVDDVAELPAPGQLVLVHGSLNAGLSLVRVGDAPGADSPPHSGKGERWGTPLTPRPHGEALGAESPPRPGQGGRSGTPPSLRSDEMPGPAPAPRGDVATSPARPREADAWDAPTTPRADGAPAPGPADRASLLVLTDRELFGITRVARPVRRRAPSRDRFLADLSPGDYVVHVEHGVGRYQGIVRMAPDGVERDYLVLEYASGDRLFVPTDQADRVGRYVGVGDSAPTLHRLGTTDWVRTKGRVRMAVLQMARDLLELYAARQVKPGHAFSPDTQWQRELEASFPYVETPDQLTALAEIKADMERPKPMDRLLCGDVGFGKTEVAIRAAFKAVMDGKQVAVLVPTTVLAQQHYNTFTQRMQAFPVTIEMLSRFRSEREQRAILAALAEGKIDICIGTHRLIQKDVRFKDLGLVIVDEEQRFGVGHKERLKQLRKEVDVLTLTATPIPRTLHMALVGVRDMSTIDTPPEDRLPIKTYVVEYDERLVREAILRELDRGGQVYFVHNRVQSIYHVARRLAELVPEAEFAVGHGQMPEEQLEKVMLDFAAGKYDVLVSSTIIESGLDIPNVNTIIVHHAERFGLAQLYQLRGRVGRGANRAFAYFTYPKGHQLSEVAEKRLRTIFEASELGAGYQIALKDLEIRGAGNLLGPEQHGHVAAVGFHLYTQLLADAVKALKGEPVVRPPTVTVDLPLDAYLPSSYVEDEAARLNLYQRLAAVADDGELGQLTLELQDRFGAPPEAVFNLIYLVQIKLLAARAGIGTVALEGDDIVLRTTHGQPVRRPALDGRLGGVVTVGSTLVRLHRQRAGADWRGLLQELLEAMAGDAALAKVGG